jgi:hypothetical protein
MQHDPSCTSVKGITPGGDHLRSIDGMNGSALIADDEDIIKDEGTCAEALMASRRPQGRAG